MNRLESAYILGMTKGFQRLGLSKAAASIAATKITNLKKEAAAGLGYYAGLDDPERSLYDFPRKEPKKSWTSWLLPLLAVLGTGTVMYNAGKTGDQTKSWGRNLINYLGRTHEKYIRKTV